MKDIKKQNFKNVKKFTIICHKFDIFFLKENVPEISVCVCVFGGGCSYRAIISQDLISSGHSVIGKDEMAIYSINNTFI